MKRIFTFLLLTGLLPALLTAQGETRELSPFERIKVLGDIEIVLHLGEQPRAEVEVRNAELEELITSVDQNLLTVQFDQTFHLGSSKFAKIHLYTASVTYIEFGAGAYVTSDRPMEIDELELDGKSGGQVDFDIQAREIEVRLVTGAEVILNGKARDLEVDVFTGGSFKGSQLECRAADVKAASGGSITVNVSDKLNAESNTGGVVRYMGDPQSVNRHTGIGGKIDKI